MFSCCYEVLTTVLSDGHRNGRGGKNEDSNSHFCVGWDGVAKHITKCSSYHHEILSAEEKSLVITTWNCSLRRPGTSRERLTKSPLMNHICQITPGCLCACASDNGSVHSSASGIAWPFSLWLVSSFFTFHKISCQYLHVRNGRKKLCLAWFLKQEEKQLELNKVTLLFRDCDANKNRLWV